jgi:hypothetical protein
MYKNPLVKLLELPLVRTKLGKKIAGGKLKPSMLEL